MIPKDELDKLMPDMQRISVIAAQTGLSYFKGAFRKKGFDNTKWSEAKIDRDGKRRRGSLMVQSAALMNSVRAASATPEKVVWAEGNDKVSYAQVHNEGGKAGRGAGFQMPQRRFMGKSDELETQIDRRIRNHLKKIFK